MREKLMKLIDKAHSLATDAEVFDDASYAQQLEMEADYLIANGVTFATDNKVGDKWIPVTERLPEICEEVLVCTTRGNVMTCHYEKDLFIQYDSWVTPDVTHWMPLPEPPKEGE